MRPFIFPSLLLLSCTGTADEGDDGEKAEPLEVEILSPEHGSSWSEGETIPLEVTATQGKGEATVDTVGWTIGGEEYRGQSPPARNLDPGNYDVVVDVVVDDKHYSGRVGIEVTEGGGDTDTDTDADADADADVDYTYAGTLSSHIWLSGDFDYDADCPGTVSFVATRDGTLAGTGYCRLDGDYDMNYQIEGTVNGRNLSGDMVMVDGGTEYRTPFTGTGGLGDTMSASFDKTYRESGNELRIQGSWTASPQ